MDEKLAFQMRQITKYLGKLLDISKISKEDFLQIFKKVPSKHLNQWHLLFTLQVPLVSQSMVKSKVGHANLILRLKVINRLDSIENFHGIPNMIHDLFKGFIS